MRTLIVDDHKINRSLLKVLIKDYFPEITTVDEAESVKASLELLETTNYDLIFLDIELKDGIGFEVIKEITDFVFVIVISSHKDYAVEAFKHNVVDYLLRPINIPEFKQAVTKVFELYEKSEAFRRSPDADSPYENSLIERSESVNDNVILVNHKTGYLSILTKDILYIHAQGKCSEIHVSDDVHYISYKNLKEFEGVMNDLFVRIHHSYIINTEHLSYYSRDKFTVTLRNGKEIPAATRKKDELLKKFNIF